MTRGAEAERNSVERMFTTLKLPFQFDRERLREDLAKVQPEDWVLHYNRADFDGDWRGTALRSSDGTTTNLVLQSGANPEFEDTPLLERCDYFREVLAAFDCPLKTVRLLSLAPQSFIREHTDRELQYEDGEVRIHIPIQTNPRVEFYSRGERLQLEEGCSYYLNASLPHRVSNRGGEERVHLVIDAEVNEWVHALFRQSLAEDWSVPRIAPEDDFTAFQKLVLEDPKLDEQLRASGQSQNFLDMVCALGGESGLHFAKADVQAAMSVVGRGELPRAMELVPADGAAEALRNWVPIRVHVEEPEPVVEWQYFGDRRFTDPFFSSTVATAARVPYASVFRRYSTLDVAEESAAAGLEPSGFIFHMSRCGSTLVSQMLAALPSNLVVSEAAPIDHVVQAEFKVPSLSTADQVRWLRQIVRALGRRRCSEARYVLKLDAWHIHQLPLFRAAFPETPWAFLYRDPLEVLAGQIEAPSLFCVPGMMEPRALGLSAEDVDVRDRFGWCCKVLSRICESALRYKDAKGILANYTSLPEFAWGGLAHHLGLELSDGDIVKMGERTRFHSKNSMFWTGKDEPPRVLKDESQRLRAAELFDPIYRELKVAAAELRG